MRILCAHCKGYHESVAEVRACSIPDNARKAFENQPQRFVREAAVEAEIQQMFPGMAIPPAKAKSEYVPAGRYALVSKGGNVTFYKVDRPTEGRWKDYTFVHIQHSDDFTPVKDSGRKGKILRTIGEDPRKASLLYGQKIGSCGVCGRTLTNEASRIIGIGPICQEKAGW